MANVCLNRCHPRAILWNIFSCLILGYNLILERTSNNLPAIESKYCVGSVNIQWLCSFISQLWMNIVVLLNKETILVPSPPWSTGSGFDQQGVGDLNDGSIGIIGGINLDRRTYNKGGSKGTGEKKHESGCIRKSGLMDSSLRILLQFGEERDLFSGIVCTACVPVQLSSDQVQERCWLLSKPYR